MPPIVVVVVVVDERWTMPPTITHWMHQHNRWMDRQMIQIQSFLNSIQFIFIQSKISVSKWKKTNWRCKATRRVYLFLSAAVAHFSKKYVNIFPRKLRLSFFEMVEMWQRRVLGAANAADCHLPVCVSSRDLFFFFFLS